MKNKLGVLACMLLSLQMAAQNDIQFGFQLSPTISWLTTSNSRINGNGSNLGLQLGMIGEYYFRENYSFATGLGFHFNAGGTLFYEQSIDTVSIWTDADIPGDNVYPGGTDFKYSLQYVEIPLGLKLRTREFGYLRYYVEPRVALGFRTQAKGNILKDAEVDPEETFDIKSAVGLINLSWGLGAGVEYTVSTKTALIGGIGFQSGFADITRDKNTQLIIGDRDSKDDSKAQLRTIVLRLGVMF